MFQGGHRFARSPSSSSRLVSPFRPKNGHNESVLITRIRTNIWYSFGTIRGHFTTT